MDHSDTKSNNFIDNHEIDENFVTNNKDNDNDIKSKKQSASKQLSIWKRLYMTTFRTFDFFINYYGNMINDSNYDGDDMNPMAKCKSTSTKTKANKSSSIINDFDLNEKLELNLSFTEVIVDLIEKTLFDKHHDKRLGKLDVNYASYLLQQTSISPESIILAIIYLNRLKKHRQNNDENCINLLKNLSSTELFIVSLIVATKFLYDKDMIDMIYNDEWSTLTNIDLDDINKFEREFLSAIKWSLFVRPEIFLEQLIKINALISLNEYRKRNLANKNNDKDDNSHNHHNTMTYMELISLFKYLRHFCDKNNEIFLSNFLSLIQGIVICSITYAIGIGIVCVSTSFVMNVIYFNDLQNHLSLLTGQQNYSISAKNSNFSDFYDQNSYREQSEVEQKINWTKVPDNAADDDDGDRKIETISMIFSYDENIKRKQKHQKYSSFRILKRTNRKRIKFLNDDNDNDKQIECL